MKSFNRILRGLEKYFKVKKLEKFDVIWLWWWFHRLKAAAYFWVFSSKSLVNFRKKAKAHRCKILSKKKNIQNFLLLTSQIHKFPIQFDSITFLTWGTLVSPHSTPTADFSAGQSLPSIQRLWSLIVPITAVLTTPASLNWKDNNAD